MVYLIYLFYSFLDNSIHNFDKPGILEKSKIKGCYGLVIILFASWRRAFVLDIRDIVDLESNGQKSLNIKKIKNWPIRYKEIQTIPNNRKKLLDYIGEIEAVVLTSEDV